MFSELLAPDYVYTGRLLVDHTRLPTGMVALTVCLMPNSFSRCKPLSPGNPQCSHDQYCASLPSNECAKKNSSPTCAGELGPETGFTFSIKRP